jgi:hypothetical protein
MKRGRGFMSDHCVVHVSDEAHAAAKAFCAANELEMTSWVSELIHDASRRAVVPPPAKAVVSEKALARYVRELYQPRGSTEFERLLTDHGAGVRE